MSKITGTELREKIKENRHMATYYVDPTAKYNYFSLPVNTPYKNIVNMTREEKMNNPRTVIIGQTIHLWKPVGEENREHYVSPVVENQPTKRKSKDSSKPKLRKNAYTIDISWCSPNKPYTLDQIMKKLPTPAAKATVLKALKRLVDDNAVKLLKKKPFTISISK